MSAAATPVPAARLRSRRRARRRTWGLAMLFLSPWLAGFLLFVAYPMVASLYWSFTHYDALGSPRWIGTANYKYMFGLTKNSDPTFWPAVRNTLFLVVFGVPVRIAFALLTALLLTAPRRGIKLYRTLYYLPTMAPPVVAALAFVYILNPALGPVDRMLGGIGLGRPDWFFSPDWSKPSVVLLSLWGVGDAMIIFLAGLLDVPRSLHEAAWIDGASAVRRFYHVTLPSLSPVIFFSLVIGMINAFQSFTEAYVAGTAVTGQQAGQAQILGEPQGSLLLYPLKLYDEAFHYFHTGYASAMAWMLFGATMMCTLVLIKTSERWVHYAGVAR